MVPIHDTDIAVERWNRAEWQHYELWERLELKLRKRRRLWILGTIILFLLLSSIPIVQDQAPAWKSLSASRRLAQEINWVKRNAGVNHHAYRLRFTDFGTLDYVIEQANGCSDLQGVPVRNGSLMKESDRGQFVLIDPAQGQNMGIPGLVTEFCYDFLSGSGAILEGKSLVGFAILPAKDLTDRRMDRVSTLLLSGPSAEISFE